MGMETSTVIPLSSVKNILPSLSGFILISYSELGRNIESPILRTLTQNLFITNHKAYMPLFFK